MSPSPVERLEERLEHVQKHGHYKTARCPAHDDKRNSLSFEEGDDGRALVKCHAGCTTDAIVAAVGLGLADLFPEKSGSNGKPRIVKTYPYTDEAGELLFECVRFDPKDFRQRRPDGNGGWEWNLKGVRRVLYRLPELRAAIDAGVTPIYFCEGEKDADAIRATGAVATCNPMGAGKWNAEYVKCLEGAGWVVVIADDDEPGKEHARRVAGELREAGIEVSLALPAVGKDISDHLADGKGLGELVPLPDEVEPVEEATEATEGDSWARVDLVARGLNPPAPPSISEIVYPGYRTMLTGEHESLKSCLAMILCLEQIRAGHSVAYVDFEMGPGMTLSRLRDLGATDDEINQRFVYIRPDERMTSTGAGAHIRGILETHRPTLIVIDSLSGALGVHGFDDNKRQDIETFDRCVITPLRSLGASTFALEHLVKDKDARGKWAIGSERKVGVCDVHLGLETIRTFGRGKHGLAKIMTHKDRPGYLARPKLGEVEVWSDPVSGAIRWELRIDDRDAEERPFRPTFLMERVSRYLELQSEPRSRTTIETDVDGNSGGIRIAMDRLILEDYVQQEPGARKAQMLSSVRAFREADDTYPSTPSNPVPTPSGTGSNPTPSTPSTPSPLT